MDVICRTAIFHCTAGNHNKQYTITVYQDDKNHSYSVDGRWGKIGYNAQGSKVYANGVSRTSAMATFAEMERERYGKGYNKISDTQEIRGAGEASAQASPDTIDWYMGSRRTATPAATTKAQPKAPPKKPAPKMLRPGAPRRVEIEDNPS